MECGLGCINAFARGFKLGCQNGFVSVELLWVRSQPSDALHVTGSIVVQRVGEVCTTLCDSGGLWEQRISPTPKLTESDHVIGELLGKVIVQARRSFIVNALFRRDQPGHRSADRMEERIRAIGFEDYKYYWWVRVLARLLIDQRMQQRKVQLRKEEFYAIFVQVFHLLKPPCYQRPSESGGRFLVNVKLFARNHPNGRLVERWDRRTLCH